MIFFTVYHRQFIVKRQIPSISRRQLFRCNEAFSNEISAYCHLISTFRTFTKGMVPYPQCIFAGYDDHGDAVILEDLRQSGYRMVNRLKGLDYEHCKIVMKVLSRNKKKIFLSDFQRIFLFVHRN